MKKIIIIGVVLVLAAGGAWAFTAKGPSEQQVSKLDINDTVIGFYSDWLKAAQEPTIAEPNRTTLAKSEILSKELRDKLVAALKAEATPDPVLCQAKLPENVSTRTVYENAEKAQVLVTSRDKKVMESSLVTLTRLNEGWYIDDIECLTGEVPPPVREFSFEKEGFLLKASVPKPYDAKNWHLVFEENGKLGHVAPLFFDATSECTSLDGKKAVCKPEQFTEATKVSVHAQMTERGASVKRMEFVK